MLGDTCKTRSMTTPTSQSPLILLHHTGVGKTCMLNVFDGKEFKYAVNNTVGVDFKTKSIKIKPDDPYSVKLQVGYAVVIPNPGPATHRAPYDYLDMGYCGTGEISNHHEFVLPRCTRHHVGI